MGSTPATLITKPQVVKAQVTVVISPAIQQRLIQINTPVFAVIATLKELGLLDAAATFTSGKPLTPQTLNISAATAAQLCHALSRVSATDTLAAEVGALVNSIPPAMRIGRPAMTRPIPTRVAPPVRPAPKPVAPAKAK